MQAHGVLKLAANKCPGISHGASPPPSVPLHMDLCEAVTDHRVCMCSCAFFIDCPQLSLEDAGFFYIIEAAATHTHF